MATYIAQTIYATYSADARTYKFDSRYSVAKFYQAGVLGVPPNEYDLYCGWNP